MQTKTIFLIIPTKNRVTTILKTDIVEHLKRGGARLIVFSDFSKDKNFKEEFRAEPVIFERLAPPTSKVMLSITSRLRNLLLRIDDPDIHKSVRILKSIKAGRLANFTFGESLRIWLRKLVVPWRKSLVRFFDWCEEFILYDANYAKLFREYKPTSVVVGTWGSDIYDLIFLAHSRRFKTASIIVDMPWSYLDNRLFYLPEYASKITVWNQATKKKLIRIYGIPEERLKVTGSIRYDYFAKNFPIESRKKFLKKIGAQPEKKLITYATVSDLWHPFQAQVTERILEAIRNKKFIKDCQLILRSSPSQERKSDYYELKKAFPELLIEESDKISDKNHLVNLLHHSDIILSVGSSLALDSAILNKPHIYIGFTGMVSSHPYEKVLKLIYEFDFLKKALMTEGVKLALSPDSLIKMINEYLKTPELNQENRIRLVKEFLGTIDGKAGERIAKVILNLHK